MLVESVIVIDEVDGSEGAVGLYLAYHATDAVAVVVMVFLVQAHSIGAQGIEMVVFRHVEALPLMHHGYEIMCLAGHAFLLKTLGNMIFGKQHHGVGPCITIG